MGKESIGKLPKLGDITLPVHLMHYDDREDKTKFFQCGFSFFNAADGSSTVTDENGNDIGSIGGTMGGHIKMTRYFPHGNLSNRGSSEYKRWVNVIIDIRDIWDQIEELLESENVKVQFDGIEEIYKKYKKEKDKKEKVFAEIKKMQEEHEQRIKAEELSKLASLLKESIKNKNVEIEKDELKNNISDVVSTYMIKEIEVYEDNNWDLNESLSGYDFEFYDYKNKEGIISNRDKEGKIPVNIGCGIKIYDTEKNIFLYTDKNSNVVTLNISSWIGISPRAIHYYGKLKFNLPDIHEEGKSKKWSTSCSALKLFDRGEIELTRKLEKWEFKKHPGVYDGWYVGDNYRGFYTQDDLIIRAKEVLKDLFSNEWKLKINKF